MSWSDSDDKHVKAFEKNKLWDNETIIDSLKGFPSDKAGSIDGVMQGRVILTNERVCYFRKGLLGDEMESIALSEIKSVETDALLAVRTLNLFSAHNKMSIKSYQKAQVFDGFSDAVQRSMRDASQSNAAAAQAPSESPTERLKAVTELLAAGVLSQEEFDTKRAQILAEL